MTSLERQFLQDKHDGVIPVNTGWSDYKLIKAGNISVPMDWDAQAELSQPLIDAARKRVGK